MTDSFEDISTTQWFWKTGIPTDVIQPTTGDWQEDQLSDLATMLCGMQIALSLVTIALNIVLILAIRGWVQLKRTSRVLLVNITVADIMICLCFASRSALSLQGIETPVSCIIPTTIASWAATSSITLILILAIDTYRAAHFINLVSNNNDNSSPVKLYSAIFVNWAFWAFVMVWAFCTSDNSVQVPCFFPNRYFDRYYVLFGSFIMIIMIPIIISFHISTVIVTSRRIREVQNIAANNSGGPFNDSDASSGQVSFIIRMKVVQKLSTITFVVCIIFLCTWGTLIIALITHKLVVEIDGEYLVYIGILVNINSASNFVVYFARSSKFRQALKQVFAMPRTVGPTPGMNT